LFGRSSHHPPTIFCREFFYFQPQPEPEPEKEPKMNQLQEFFNYLDLSNEVNEMCHEEKNMKFSQIYELAETMWDTKDKMEKVGIAARLVEEITENDCYNDSEFAQIKREAEKILEEDVRAENNN
jgi:hypothetical protein